MLKKALAKLLCLCMVASSIAVFGLNSIAFAAADSLAITVGSEFIIENGGSSNMRAFPYIYGEVNGNTIVGFSQHSDGYATHPVDGIRVSSDDGATWPVYRQITDFPQTLVKLSDGDLLGNGFIAYYVDARHASCVMSRSSDGGSTWTQYTGNIVFPQDQKPIGGSWGGFVFHRSLLVMPDGSLRATMYGGYTTDTKNRILWMKSTDNGTNWQVESTIASGNIGSDGPCEPVVIRCSDNSLLCVMRVGINYPLYQCRSTDNGLTWSTPTTLPGVNPADTYSVDPDLCLMSNGTLVLSYGRPTCKLLFSVDGKGESWSYLTTTYTGTSSCYTGIREVAPGRLLLIGDKGANWQYPPEYKIWGKYIDVQRTVYSSMDTFENDTAGQLPAGWAEAGASCSVSNTRGYQSSKSLRINDTSSSVLSLVGKVTGPSSSKVLEFEIYPAALPNGALFNIASSSNGATVFHFFIDTGGNLKWYNGTQWNVMGGAGTVSFNAWNTIRVEADNTANASVYLNGVLAGTAGKYSTSTEMDKVNFCSASTTGTGDDYYVDNVSFTDNPQTFENSTAGQVPAGWTETGAGCRVSNIRGFQSLKSLRINDTSSSVLSLIGKVTNSSTSKVLEFKMYPVALPNGALFNIADSSIGATVFHFLIDSSGNLKWYNGSQWSPLSGAGIAQFNAWNTIRVEAGNTTNAKVYLNGVLAGTAGKYGTAGLLDKINFGSGSTAGTGDDYYIDDISFINN